MSKLQIQAFNENRTHLTSRKFNLDSKNVSFVHIWMFFQWISLKRKFVTFLSWVTERESWKHKHCRSQNMWILENFKNIENIEKLLTKWLPKFHEKLFEIFQNRDISLYVPCEWKNLLLLALEYNFLQCESIN